MSTKSEHAVHRFGNGFNCSQAVLAAFAEDYDLDLDLALSLACGFGGGVGRMGDTCGAVNGAVLVLGLAECVPDQIAAATKTRVYGLVQKFVDEFRARHQTTSCRELLDCDISTPDGYLEAQRLDLFRTRCPCFVRDAVEILEGML